MYKDYAQFVLFQMEIHYMQPPALSGKKDDIRHPVLPSNRSLPVPLRLSLIHIFSSVLNAAIGDKDAASFAGVRNDQKTMNHTKAPESNVQATPVSYTHLDVYKRQIFN